MALVGARRDLWLESGTKKWSFLDIFTQNSQNGPHPRRRVMQRWSFFPGIGTPRSWEQTARPLDSAVGWKGYLGRGPLSGWVGNNFSLKPPPTNLSGPSTWRSRLVRRGFSSPMCGASVVPKEWLWSVPGVTCGSSPVPKSRHIWTFSPKIPRMDPAHAQG